MSKPKAQAQKKQQADAPQEAAIGVTARAYPVHGKGPTLANASVDLGGEYAVRGIRVVQGKDGPFVAMPQRRTGKGEYQDVVFPVTKEARERLINTVLDAYEQALEQTAKQAEAPEQDGPVLSM